MARFILTLPRHSDITQKLNAEKSRADRVEEELFGARKQHTELAKEQGTFKAEFEAQQERLSERETLIQKISEKFKIKGYSSLGLDAAQVIEFISKLKDLHRRQRLVVETLQREGRQKTEDFTRKSTELNNALQSSKAQRTLLQNQLSKNQTSISLAERELDATQNLLSKLIDLTGDIDEKRSRLSKTASTRELEERRDVLNSEFKVLNMQSDARTRLNIQRTDVKSRTAEIEMTLSNANSAFRRLVGAEPNPDTMEREVDRVLAEKEQELGDVEAEAASANSNLQQAQNLLSGLKAQLQSKKDELKGLEKQLKTNLEHDTLDTALEEASKEVDHRKMHVSVALTTFGSSQVWEGLLRAGKQKKVCTTCNRHLDNHQMVVFEKILEEQMRKSSPESVAALQEELKEWEGEMGRLQKLRPVLSSRDRLKDTKIPELDTKIKVQDATIPATSAAAELFSGKIDDLKRDIRDARTLKSQAQTVSRLQKDLKRAIENVSSIEDQLSATGSTKTVNDVQNELDDLTSEIRKNDKQREALLKEKDNRNGTTRAFENQIHAMEMEAVDLKTKIRAKSALEDRIQQMKKEIITFNALIKVTEEDAKILQARAPIEALEEEHTRAQQEVNLEISNAQALYQELTTSDDRLSQTNKGVVSLMISDSREPAQSVYWMQW
ncbi:hypothetical protein C8R46DRAFT_1035956 [Mycena filopes]|nr:hypothetical protein C8R46DRAFT_1035956 [Mycena filopes]